MPAGWIDRDTMSLGIMRTDFRRAVLTLLGGSAVAGVLPFVWYRFAQGQVLAGLADIAIAAALVGVIVYAWRGGNIDVASRVCVLASAVGCIAVTWLVGLAGVLWTYPLVLGTFVLLERRMAVLLSGLSIAAIATIAIHRDILLPGSPVVMFVATSLVAGVFALLFAERARMQHIELEELAARDPLTGAFNRRAMNRELRLAVEAKARHGANFGLALIDIDHFKRINDTHGHEAGDQVLVDFVAVVRAGIRKLDQVYRMGGEEFLVLFSAMDPSALPSVCDGLRARIEAHLRCGETPVTASIGCAMLQRDEVFASWLARADAALYRAKDGGRNRVVLAAPAEAGRIAPARARGASVDTST
jgi:diguanylate cyclase (GGDEF)-like protein